MYLRSEASLFLEAVIQQHCMSCLRIVALTLCSLFELLQDGCISHWPVLTCAQLGYAASQQWYVNRETHKLHFQLS